VDAVHEYQSAIPEAADGDSQSQSGSSTQQAQAEKHGAGDAAERLDAFTKGFREQIDEAGEIQMCDGLTWWERTVNVFGEIRANVTTWARERWQGFVDFVDSARGRGDYDRDDPDLGR